MFPVFRFHFTKYTHVALTVVSESQHIFISVSVVSELISRGNIMLEHVSINEKALWVISDQSEARTRASLMSGCRKLIFPSPLSPSPARTER